MQINHYLVLKEKAKSTNNRIGNSGNHFQITESASSVDRKENKVEL